MCLGASNVSFGLPERNAVNAAFLAMAMSAGLTSAIMNALAPECVTAVRASDLLLGNDPWGANWIAAFRTPPSSSALSLCAVAAVSACSSRRIGVNQDMPTNLASGSGFKPSQWHTSSGVNTTTSSDEAAR